MRVQEIKVYTFEELSEDVQEKVIERMAQNAVEYDSSFWFENMVEDAKESASFKIVSLNDNPIDGEGSFLVDAETTANAILENHGDVCQTYKIAFEFLEDRASLLHQMERDGDELTANYESDIEELEQQFEKDIAHEYAVMWDKEMIYQTSEEAIKENIEANEYEFLASGKMAGSCLSN